MRTLFYTFGLLLLFSACKREEIKLQSTIIQGATKDQQGDALPKIEVWITGNKGSYFTGTRKDTIFAKLATDSLGALSYKQVISNDWRVYLSPNGFPNYELVKFEGTVDGIVNVGQANNITAIMRKR